MPQRVRLVGQRSLSGSTASSRLGSAALPGLQATWRELLAAHQARRADNGFKLWVLLMWVLFAEAVLDPPAGPRG